MTMLTSMTATTTTRRRSRRPRGRGGVAHTIIGVAILAVLLFPLYWMLNVSLQHSSGAVATPWLPTDISFHGYATALHDQGGHLLTSLEIAIGSVIFSLLIAAPAAYALAQFTAPTSADTPASVIPIYGCSTIPGKDSVANSWRASKTRRNASRAAPPPHRLPTMLPDASRPTRSTAR